MSATRHYIGLIHKDADSDFGVSFPDLQGVVTAGTTLDDAWGLWLKKRWPCISKASSKMAKLSLSLHHWTR